MFSSVFFCFFEILKREKVFVPTLSQSLRFLISRWNIYGKGRLRALGAENNFFEKNSRMHHPHKCIHVSLSRFSVSLAKSTCLLL